MLSEEKLRIYKLLKGDIDSFGRTTNKRYKDLINESDFRIIDGLVQDQKLINNNLCSKNYKDKFEITLRNLFGENSNAKFLLNELVELQAKWSK